MKRKLSIFLCVICMALMLPVMKADASSGQVVHSGVCGDLKWSIKDNGEFILEGSGDLAQREYGSFAVDKNGKEIFIPTNDIAWSKYKDKIVHAKIRVKNVKSLASILSDCYNLETVDFTGSDTSKTIDFSGLLATEYVWNGKSNKLKHADLSMLDTSSAIRMSQLFWGCTSLETVNVSGWNTSNVTDLGSLFDCCKSLNKISGIERWDTSNVTNMFAVFQLCKSLQTLDLSGWNTRNVADLNSAFNGCENLEVLKVSNWNVSKVKDFYRTFDRNCSLKELDLTKWDMSSAENIAYMFSECYKLSGGITLSSNLSNYDMAFYATAYEAEKPFVIDHKGACGRKLIDKIYATNEDYGGNLVVNYRVFDDVLDGAWYKEYVQYVYDKAIMSGSAHQFNPTKDVTRAQLAAILQRFCEGNTL